MDFILASSSPRRKDLLTKLVTNYEVIPSTFNEDSIKTVEKDPQKLVEKLAFYKGKEVFTNLEKQRDNFIVISGDTIVYQQGTVLGKPKSELEAYQMLKNLQNNKNEVYTGTSVFIKNESKLYTYQNCSSSSVYFKPMSEKDIYDYIATKEPMDKAGAYAIQGIGKKYIEKLEGDFDVVVGLDTAFLKSVLDKFLF